MNNAASARNKTRRLVYAALFLALAQVLPFITGQIPEIGAMLCPMHLPVLLCGFLCGWGWGLGVGFVAPLLRSVLFGMPAMFPDAVAMAFELAVYGAATGWLRKKLPQTNAAVYAALLIAMALGRVVWGAVKWALLGLTGAPFTFAAFLAGAVTNAVPGILLQIAVIPLLVVAMEKAGLSLNGEK